MSKIEFEITKKGALYSAECVYCGAVMYTHEWAHADHNYRRDAMEAGKLRCSECFIGKANLFSFHKYPRLNYAGRLDLPGYSGYDNWVYSASLRRLRAELTYLTRDIQK